MSAVCLKPDLALVHFDPTEPEFYLLECAAHGAPWSRAMFIQCSGRLYRTRALYAAGQLVGFSICYLVADEVTLMNIAVHPKHQGNGYGRVLFQDIIDFISDQHGQRQRTLFLEVRESNHAAIALYQRFGLSDIGRRPGYYPPIPPATANETAVVMRLGQGHA
ncbi:ribosomal protein S18-alanine N-acetyltransferase [Aliidiomarina maris]|uniref:[SSU ribosomal protein S18P]-alanine acetyltransferase n=2 Tax=Aliidiomarina maris TaxID=531312 RepID=A0A327WWE6_9GAMM|nr:ribosomal protein S18-alanine N-acetyltransferase [Aliidiomarina maris]RAJ93610.1 [SSU ribosomal protein S18P]-alanine acetyltransferase [Aliidiomarina maris]